jgi:hypothetical protein
VTTAERTALIIMTVISAVILVASGIAWWTGR